MPNPSKYRAIIIGSSVKDPVKKQEKSRMVKTYGFIGKAAAKNIPKLGICGGLQFVVKALGGTIIKNPLLTPLPSARISALFSFVRRSVCTMSAARQKSKRGAY